jgi:hypothetical protein
VAENNLPAGPVITARTFDLTQLAIWINVNTEPNSTVAHHEVGLLQWLSNRRIVDLLGLITPDVIPTLFRYGATLGPAFEMLAPDYWIDNRALLDPTIRYSDYFIQNYIMIDTYLGTEGGRYYMYRRDPSRVHTTAQDVVFDPKQAQTMYVTEMAYGDNGSVAATAGLDPFFEWKDLNLCADDYPYLIVDIAVAGNVASDARFMTVLYAPAGLPMSGERSLGTRELSTDGMQRYVINTQHQLPLWQGVIDRLRFDPIEDSAGQGKFQLKQLRLVRGEGPSHCGSDTETAIPITSNDVILDFNQAVGHQVHSAGFTATGDYQFVAGSDPYLVWNDLNLCADDYPTMLVEMSAPATMQASTRVLAVFYTPPNTPISEERSVRIPLASVGDVQRYVIDLPERMPDWTGTINTLRVDPVVDGSSEPIVIKQIRLVRGAGNSNCE